MKKLLPSARLMVVFIFCTLLYTQTIAQPNTPKAPLSHTNKRVLYGTASFYADKFNGRQTANGEIFRQDKLTCACNVLPFGTWIRVSNVHNGKSVVVKVNDRLHPKMRRIVDLTKASAMLLGYKSLGIVRVKVEVLGKTRPVQ